jgi:nucleoside-diphosphate-sugar epimerase
MLLFSAAGQFTNEKLNAYFINMQVVNNEATPILVTGCAGFIGHHLCHKLLSCGFQVVGLDECNDFYDPSIKHDSHLMSIPGLPLYS